MLRWIFAIPILFVFSNVGSASSALIHSEEAVPTFAAKAGAPTLPPIGFVDFCKRYNQECTKWAAASGRVHLNGRGWELVNRVNRQTNAEIAPATDDLLYKTTEHWEYPVGAGDCEDYVLRKRRLLLQEGVPIAMMPITVVLDETGGGHAVLTLLTDAGDLVLDNRRDDIRDWRFTGYTFLKRQSQKDPRTWIVLQNGQFEGPVTSKMDRAPIVRRVAKEIE